MRIRRAFVGTVAATALVLALAPTVSAHADVLGSISGTVSDAGANPLAGVTLTLTGSASATTTSASNGTFTFVGLTPGDNAYTICGTGSTATGGSSTTGYLDACAYSISVTAGQATTGVTVTLPSAGAISGTVTDTTANPLANVAVVVISMSGLGSTIQTHTAADGSYRVTGLIADNYSVCFDAGAASGGTSTRGYTNQCWQNLPYPIDGYCPCDNTPVPVTAGATATGVSAQLEAAGAISGTVKDANGQPLAGVVVYAEVGPGSPPTAVQHATTAADGTYLIGHLGPSDQYTVCFDAANATGGTSSTGYLDQCDGGLPAQAWGGTLVPFGTYTPFTVSSASTVTGKDATLALAGQLSGTVTDSHGNPIAGVRVSADGQNDFITATDVTDANGHYLLSVDNNGGGANGEFHGTRLPVEPYTLYFSTFSVPAYVNEFYHHVYSPGSQSWDAPTLVTPAANGTPTVVDETLTQSGSIAGSVLDPVDNSPITGVTLTLKHDGVTQLTTATAADGSYSFGGLPPGTYTLCADDSQATSTASPAGYFDECYDSQPINGTPDGITITTEGQHVTGIDLHPAEASRIRSHVTDSSGQGVFGISVTISQQGTTVGSFYTDFDGNYESGPLPAGSYTVCFREGEYPPRGYGDQCYDDVAPGGMPTPVVTVAGQIAEADAVMHAPVSRDKTPPTVVPVGPAKLFQTSTTVTATYSATDTGSGVASYDVRYRRASWNGAFTAYGSPTAWLNTTKTSVSLTGSAGQTYCFSVRARDHAGNVSAWSPDRCTALPVDDRSLTTAGTWTRRSSNWAYDKTVSTTTSSGASLTLKATQAVHFDLLVATCPTCGSVTISVNGKAVRTLSTKSSSGRYLVFVLSMPVTTRPATITITSVTKNAPVIIDGLGVSRV